MIMFNESHGVSRQNSIAEILRGLGETLRGHIKPTSTKLQVAHIESLIALKDIVLEDATILIPVS